MKKSLLYALPITLVLGSTVAFAMVSKQPETTKNTVKESTTMTPEASPEATPAPTQQETTPQPSTSVPAPQQPQDTLESLIVQYQWDMSGGLNGTLGQWMRRWPQYFTQSEMSTAFKYMHDVGLAYAVKSGKTDITPSTESLVANAYWNLLYNWGGAGEQGGTPQADAARWIFMGEYTGIDTSRYE